MSLYEALVEVIDLQDEIEVAINNKDMEHLKQVEQKVNLLKSVYPHLSSLKMMQEWIDENKNMKGM